MERPPNLRTYAVGLDINILKIMRMNYFSYDDKGCWFLDGKMMQIKAG
jgi:hypothetical protein